MVVKIPAVFLKYGSSNAVLSLRQFELNDSGELILNKNIPNERDNIHQNLLGFIVTAAGVNRNVTKALCILLDDAFHIISSQNGNNVESGEKLVVLTIDETLSLNDNLSAASDEFKQHGIILAVVTDRIFPDVQYYCTLARNTGGECMLLSDASATLERVILGVIHDGGTLREAFHRVHAVNVPLVTHLTNDTNEHTEETDAADAGAGAAGAGAGAGAGAADAGATAGAADAGATAGAADARADATGAGAGAADAGATAGAADARADATGGGGGDDARADATGGGDGGDFLFVHKLSE